MKKNYPPAGLGLLACILFLFLFAPFIVLQAGVLPDGFAELRLAEGLDGTTVNYAPDGRLFVTQKKGVITIIKNGSLLPAPFMDLQAQVDNWNERGLQSMVFDPDFQSNGFIYLYYCAAGQNRNRITRVTASGDVVLAGSEVVILNLDNLPGDIHNGGGMFFKDGKLFLTTGEGSNGSLAQSFSSLLGKVLRLNPDGSVPNDNPYYNTLSGNYRMIYALGFRNPFRAAIQPGTGKVFINDVGGSQWEEINELVAGKNYGWPTIEGKRVGQTAPSNYQDPLYAYSHAEGCSIGGGAFYNPSTALFPSKYIGKYFFGDYCGNYIKVLDPATGTVIETFGTSVNRPISFTVAPDGSFYYLARGGLGGGSKEANTQSCCSEVWRIQFTSSGVPTISAQPSNVVVPIGGTALFAVGASGNAPLQYQWQRNGVNIPGATNFVYELTSATLADNGATFRAVVRNPLGNITSNGAVLTVTDNLPPVPVITLPTEGFQYKAGTTLTFAGMATDPEDGILPASAFTWEINFHHATHTHPAMPPTNGVSSGTYALASSHEPAADVWYRIYLTVTDSEGQTATTYRDVYPILSHVTLMTNQPGLKLMLDGSEVTPPYAFTGAAGIHRHVEAPLSQQMNGTTYDFVGWSDGGAAEHEFETPTTDQTLSAFYLPLILEAENSTLSGAAVKFGYAGFTGTGYGDYDGNTGAYIEWMVNLPAGSYKLDFRYGNGTNKDRPLQIMVNGAVVEANKPFPPTGLWTSWNVVSSIVNLQQGNNVIRATTTGANGGNIDHLVIRKATADIPVVSSPVSTPAGGTYTSDQQVTLTTATTGAVIYYTLDGSTPTTASTVYSTAISIASTKTIKTFAVKSGMTNSSVTTATFTIDPNPPAFSVQLEAEDATRSGVPVKFSYTGFTGTGYGDYGGAGTYVEWTVNAPASGNYILDFRYANGATRDRPLQIKINGNITEAAKSFAPTGLWTTWSLASSTVALQAGSNTIRATVTGTDGANVDHLVVRQAGVVVPGVAAPVFTPAAGTYASAQTVSISSTATAVIRYTTDGTTPGASSTIYSSPVIVAASATLKAYAVKAGLSDSPVSTAVYVINPSLPPFSEILEAENAVRSGVTVKFSYAGYTGTGYGDFTNASGDYIEWTANVPASGNYQLDFRYGLPTGNRPLQLGVNGAIIVSSKSFPATGAWTTWGVVSETVALNAGNNTIRITANGSNGANVDHLKVSAVTASSSVARVAATEEEETLELATENVEDVEVFPVPASDVLTIRSQSPIELVNMVSMNGAIVQPPYTKNSESEIEVRLHTVDAGTYIITVRSSSRYVRRKVIIQK